MWTISKFILPHAVLLIFFFNDTATTEIYTLSLHDALPIWGQILRSDRLAGARVQRRRQRGLEVGLDVVPAGRELLLGEEILGRHVDGLPSHGAASLDRKSTRLNSRHLGISYAVFRLKKKKTGENCVPSVGHAFVYASCGQSRGAGALAHQAVQPEDGLPGGRYWLVEPGPWGVAGIEG